MKKQSKKLRRVGLFGLMFFFFIQFIVHIMAPLDSVNAQSEQALYIDKTKISFRNIVYTDTNPYDTELNYRGGPAGDGDCRPYINILNAGRDNESAEVFLLERRTGSGGSVTCHSIDLVTVPLGNLERRDWTAYRIDADTIFVPAAMNDPDECSERYSSGTSRYASLFLRPARSDPDREGDSTYLLTQHGEDNPLDNRFHVNTGGDDRDAELVMPGRCWGRGEESYNVGTLILANNGDPTQPDEDIYGISSDNVPTPENPSGGGGSGGQGDTAEDECYDNAAEEGGLGWIICDVLRYGDNFSNELLVKIRDLLEFNERDYNDPDGNMRKAWSYFRNIASFALIIIGLVMVIGQATSKE